LWFSSEGQTLDIGLTEANGSWKEFVT
jgi:hypothetical protein